jgi:hypothetical protein
VAFGPACDYVLVGFHFQHVQAEHLLFLIFRPPFRESSASIECQFSQTPASGGFGLLHSSLSFAFFFHLAFPHCFPSSLILPNFQRVLHRTEEHGFADPRWTLTGPLIPIPFFFKDVDFMQDHISRMLELIFLQMGWTRARMFYEKQFWASFLFVVRHVNFCN